MILYCGCFLLKMSRFRALLMKLKRCVPTGHPDTVALLLLSDIQLTGIMGSREAFAIPHSLFLFSDIQFISKGKLSINDIIESNVWLLLVLMENGKTFSSIIIHTSNMLN